MVGFKLVISIFSIIVATCIQNAESSMGMSAVSTHPGDNNNYT